MATTRLQDDLLNEFREEKKLINNQIETFDPLAVSLRKPAAQRLASKGLIIFGEILCWLAILGCIAFAIFLNKLYPFYLLFTLRTPAYSSQLGNTDTQMLLWSFYGLIAIAGLLFLMLSRSLRHIRQKNDILYVAGKNIKSLVGQHLQRKAAIDAIEQRHLLEFPETMNDGVNEVLNPGYDGKAPF